MRTVVWKITFEELVKLVKEKGFKHLDCRLTAKTIFFNEPIFIDKKHKEIGIANLLVVSENTFNFSKIIIEDDKITIRAQGIRWYFYK